MVQQLPEAVAGLLTRRPTVGRAYAKGRRKDVHVEVWESLHGPVPLGHTVHHVDHDKTNNAPDNLVLMTHQQHSAHHNQKHALTKPCEVCGTVFTPSPTKRHRAKTCSPACARAMMSAANVGRGKLDDEDVREIRSRLKAGERQKDLAEEYQVSKGTMSVLANGKTWTHVT